MKPLRSWVFVLVACVLRGLSPAPLQAAEGAARLLQLLPPDPAVCLVVQDLGGQLEAWNRSGLAEVLFQSPLAQLLPEEWPRTLGEDLDRALQHHVQCRLHDLATEVLGDSLVLAFWPATDKAPEKAVILSTLRQPQQAAQLLERLHDSLRRSCPGCQLQTRSHAGFRYTCFTDADNRPQFHALARDLLVLSQDEEATQQVLQQLAQPPRDPLASPLARKFLQMQPDQAACVFLLDPRAVLPELAAQLQQAPEAEAAFLGKLLDYAKTLHAVGVTLRLQPQPAVVVSLLAETDAWPEPARILLAEAAKPCTLWSHVPSDAICVLAVRCPFSALWAFLTDFLPPEVRRQTQQQLEQSCQALLGLDFSRQLLPSLGPDVLLYLGPPPGLLSLTPELVLAIGIRTAPDQPHLAEELTDALKTLGGILALARTQAGQPTRLRTRYHGNTRIVCLEADDFLLPGLQPAAAVKDGCLVLALSPASIVRFRRRGDPPPQQDLVLAELAAHRACLSYLDSPLHRAAWAALLAPVTGTEPAQVQAQLATVRDTLRTLRVVQLRCRPQPGGLAFELLLQPGR